MENEVLSISEDGHRYMKHDNPKVKIGDLILIIEGNNDNEEWEGEVCRVIVDGIDIVNGIDNIVAQSISGYPKDSKYFYYSGPTDEFVLTDRQSRIRYRKGSVKCE